MVKLVALEHLNLSNVFLFLDQDLVIISNSCFVRFSGVMGFLMLSLRQKQPQEDFFDLLFCLLIRPLDGRLDTSLA